MTRVEYERRRRRWSQDKLGTTSNIPQPTISKIERRLISPLPRYVERLSDALGVPPAALLYEGWAEAEVHTAHPELTQGLRTRAEG